MRRSTVVWTLCLGRLLACRAKRAGPDVGALIEKLKSPDPAVSGKANLALIRVGEPALPPLVPMLQSEDRRVRKIAARTLWGLGAKAKAAVPVLVVILSDAETELRPASSAGGESCCSTWTTARFTRSRPGTVTRS